MNKYSDESVKLIKYAIELAKQENREEKIKISMLVKELEKIISERGDYNEV